MIEFRDVSYAHENGVRALVEVSVEIQKGETVAIVGENGAGKTTLVRHMNGLLKPSSGVVAIDGESTRDRSTAQLSRRVGVAFQNPDHQLFSDTVEHEITFALKNFGFEPSLVNQRLDWALNFFGLEQYRNSSPLTLSGGEKKRLTLACILAWDPEVIVLDEPTVGQDALQKEKLAGISTLLRSTGKTMVIVSHDVEFLWPLQPRLIVMSKGRILGDGPASEIMRNRSMLDRARVTQPQLLQIFEAMADEEKPGAPFIDVLEARRWIGSKVKERRRGRA
jgi:energy-coupling factor transport system ATP-binding protein